MIFVDKVAESFEIGKIVFWYTFVIQNVFSFPKEENFLGAKEILRFTIKSFAMSKCVAQNKSDHISKR